MRHATVTTVPFLLLFSLTQISCKDKSPDHKAVMDLSLIRAGLAARISTGSLAADAFCEKPLPYVYIHHADIDFQCTNNRFHWKITEERGDQTLRSLRNKAQKILRLKKISAQRYQLRGSPCDQKPELYVQFDQAQTYRQRWLKHAHCPGQDMRLAE